MREGRVIGATIGVGLLAGLGILLVSRRSSASTRGSPRETGFGGGESRGGGAGTSWGDDAGQTVSSRRFPPLVERWRSAVAKRAKDLPVDAILEWIRIESGGDMCSTGLPSEVGIFQLMFPDDSKYGATLEGLRAICEKSKTQNPRDLSWLTEADLDMQVGSGIRKMLAARDSVRKVFAQHNVRWPETSFDFGSAVKQIHAAPAVITELLPKIARRDGASPSSWNDLRQKALSFPVAQMGQGLARLANSPSKQGLKNRLEDTLRNAEFVGRLWAPDGRAPALVGHGWR